MPPPNPHGLLAWLVVVVVVVVIFINIPYNPLELWAKLATETKENMRQDFLLKEEEEEEHPTEEEVIFLLSQRPGPGQKIVEG